MNTGDKPARCSLCFHKFMPNHTPQKVEVDNSVRWMHKACRDAYWRERNSSRWSPVRVIKPDSDEK